MARDKKNFWFKETDLPYWNGAGVRTELFVKKQIHEEQSGYQHIQVFDIALYGKSLVLDGILQTTEADEFVYHEMLVLMPLVLTGRPQKILIVGGGDGGAARQAVRVRSLKKILMVELSERVVEVCAKYLPKLSQRARNDPRVELVIGDGMEWIKKFSQEFDVVSLDLTDPEPNGPSAKLYESPFFKDIKKALKKGGILAVQSGSLSFQTEWVKILGSSLLKVFPYVDVHSAVVPSYQAGLYSFILASEKPLNRMSISQIRRVLKKNVSGTCKYFSSEIYFASKVLPSFLKEQLCM